jgi:peptidoglycan hydrolase-like protein with peptidoglycan-binding domain
VNRTVTCLTSHFSLFTLIGASPVTIANIPQSPLIYSPSAPVTPSGTTPETTASSTLTSTSTFLTTLTSSSTLPLFTRTLRYGSQGDDVKALQVFLNTNSFTVALTGNGSQGQETTFFGHATRRALIRFQEFYADEILTPLMLTKGTGIFGEMTRKKVEGR